jgi:hypothetical protein
MPEQESHDRQEGHLRFDPREPTSLDEVAKGLASGAISRRKALRLVGGMLGGALLASIPRVAAARDEVCPDASACCSCGYAERENPEDVTRRKCFSLTTRTCSGERVARLIRQCERLCRENRRRGTVVVESETTITCARGVSGLQAVCGGGEAPPRVCNFEACEPPAGTAGDSEEQEGRVIRRWP